MIRYTLFLIGCCVLLLWADGFDVWVCCGVVYVVVAGLLGRLLVLWWCLVCFVV